MKRNVLVKKISKFFANFIMLLLSVISIYPVIWMFYSSFKSKKDYSINIIGLPKNIEIDNYSKALRVSKIDIYYKNSLMITLISVLVVICVGFMAGYCLARCRFRGRNLVYGIFLMGMLIPLHSLLIPVFIEFRVLGLYDRLISLVIVNSALNLSISIFLAEGFIRTIPYCIEESAIMVGCSRWKMMFQIIMPLCKPVISTSLILTFLATWNEFPFALILISNNALKTIPVGISNFFGEFSTNYTELMAGSILSIIPIVLIYIFYSKRIMEGLTAGAVKG